MTEKIESQDIKISIKSEKLLNTPVRTEIKDDRNSIFVDNTSIQNGKNEGVTNFQSAFFKEMEEANKQVQERMKNLFIEQNKKSEEYEKTNDSLITDIKNLHETLHGISIDDDSVIYSFSNKDLEKYLSDMQNIAVSIKKECEKSVINIEILDKLINTVCEKSTIDKDAKSSSGLSIIERPQIACDSLTANSLVTSQAISAAVKVANPMKNIRIALIVDLLKSYEKNLDDNSMQKKFLQERIKNLENQLLTADEKKEALKILNKLLERISKMGDKSLELTDEDTDYFDTDFLKEHVEEIKYLISTNPMLLMLFLSRKGELNKRLASSVLAAIKIVAKSGVGTAQLAVKATPTKERGLAETTDTAKEMGEQIAYSAMHPINSHIKPIYEAWKRMMDNPWENYSTDFFEQWEIMMLKIAAAGKTMKTVKNFIGPTKEAAAAMDAASAVGTKHTSQIFTTHMGSLIEAGSAVNGAVLGYANPYTLIGSEYAEILGLALKDIADTVSVASSGYITGAAADTIVNPEKPEAVKNKDNKTDEKESADKPKSAKQDAGLSERGKKVTQQPLEKDKLGGAGRRRLEKAKEAEAKSTQESILAEKQKLYPSTANGYKCHDLKNGNLKIEGPLSSGEIDKTVFESDTWKNADDIVKSKMLDKTGRGLVPAHKGQGVKVLNGTIDGYHYECKILGKGGKYRLLGELIGKDKNGNLCFKWFKFEQTH